MGKIMHKKFTGMSVTAKAALISLFTLLLTVGLYQAMPKTSQAVSAQSAWILGNTTTTIPTGSVGNSTININTSPVGNETGRLLLVAISATRTTAGAINPNAPTVGGQTLTLAIGDFANPATYTHTAIYYANDYQIRQMTGLNSNGGSQSPTGYPLLINLSGQNLKDYAIYTRVYNDVDQIAPFSDKKFFSVGNSTANTTVGPLTPNLTVNAGDSATQIVALGNNTPSGTNATVVRSIQNWASGWTMGSSTQNVLAPASSTAVADRSVPASTILDPSTHTTNGLSVDSMSAVSIASGIVRTITLDTNTSLIPATGKARDTDTGVLMQRLKVTANAQLTLTNLYTADIGTATNIASERIYISPTASVTLPGDAVLIGTRTNFTGATATAVPLTTGTVQNRTLGGTDPLTKYIYITYNMSPGQAGMTVNSQISGIDTNTTALVTGQTYSSGVVNLSYSGNVLTASALVLGKTTAKDSDPADVMIYFKAECNTDWDNILQLSSVTINDIAAGTSSATLGGTAGNILSPATQIAIVSIYVSPTVDADPAVLPSAAKLAAQITAWNKTSTVIPLVTDFGATTTDLSVTPASPKYIYVVYSMFYPDDLDLLLADPTNQTAQSNGLYKAAPGEMTQATVKATVTAVGVASPDFGVTGLSYSSNQLQLARGTWSKITSCGGCHKTAQMSDSTIAEGRNPDFLTGLFPGSHAPHNDKNNIDCSVCHKKPTVYNHADGYINFSGTRVRGGHYTNAPTDNLKVSNAVKSLGDFGTCTNTYCHGPVSPVWGVATSTDATCVKCHGIKGLTYAQYSTDKRTSAPGYLGTGLTLAGNSAKTDPVAGAHDTHLRALNGMSSVILCTECHLVPATATQAGHIDLPYPSSVNMAGNSTTLSIKRGAVPAYDYSTHTCSNSYCHYGKATGSYSPAAPVAWNNTSYITGNANQCNSCHLSPPSSTLGVHAPYAGNMQSCNTCHSHFKADGTGFSDVSLHINGIVEATGGHTFPYGGAAHMNAGTGSCGCHDMTSTGVTYAQYIASGAQGSRSAPNCTVCHVLGLKTEAYTSNSSCYDCHGTDAAGNSPSGAAFPNLAASHNTHVVSKGMTCVMCHSGGGSGVTGHGNRGGTTKTTADVVVASDGTYAFTFSWVGGSGKGTCSSLSCHGTAEWGVTAIDCISCHSTTQLITVGSLAGQGISRAAVAATLKFSGTRSHKSTAVGSDASKFDCIVCHLEGNPSTGTTTSYHANGVIDFRDPDTGVQIKKVSWNGNPYSITQNAEQGAGRYVDTLTNFTTARFSRNLSVVLESDPAWLNIASIQKNLCLKCHDYNGASSSLAQSKNTGVTATAVRPFGQSVSSTATTYYIGIAGTSVAQNTAAANTAGNVMNVFSQFSTGNASYHPVLGRQNNGYATGARMQAPWGNSTKSFVKGSSTVYGYLISCFDCHGNPGATGVQTSTLVAHGNTSNTASSSTYTVPVMRNNASVWVGATSGSANLCTTCHAGYTYSTTYHTPGSAWAATGSNHNTSVCAQCHSNANTTTGARATDAHGSNAMADTGSAGNTFGTRPYAFMRSRNNMGNWRPGTCQSVSGCTQTTGYTPGGVY